MRHELFPEKVYNQLIEYNENIITNLVYDGREVGDYSKFEVLSGHFDKATLMLLFSMSQYPSVYLFKGKLCVDLEFEL